jgi:ferrous-iron efflux pump FieF
MPHPDNARLLRLATLASVGTAIVLIATKLGASLFTNSVSVMASLLDSTMDLLASLVTLVAVRIALQPPDAEHRFGHGKAEPLAALAQATFIIGSGVFLMLHAVQRLLRPQPVEDIGVGVGVMIFSILATAVLLLFQRYVIRRTGSTAIHADALHYAADLLTNASIIAALLLTGIGWIGVDAVFALLIGGYIVYSAVGNARTALDQLMDREIDGDTDARVRNLALTHPAVREVCSIRTRRSGQTTFIQLYIHLDPDTALIDAHRIGDEVQAILADAFPGADIFLHEEPWSAPGCR